MHHLGCSSNHDQLPGLEYELLPLGGKDREITPKTTSRIELLKDVAIFFNGKKHDCIYIYIFMNNNNTQHFNTLFLGKKRFAFVGGFFQKTVLDEKNRFDSSNQGGLFPTFPFCRDWWRDILEVTLTGKVGEEDSGVKNVIILFGGIGGSVFMSIRTACSTTQIWVVVSNIFYFHLYLGKWSNLTSIFFKGVGWKTTKQQLMDFPFVDWMFVEKHGVKPTAWWN